MGVLKNEDRIALLEDRVGSMETAYEGALVKLDSDTGVADTNYAATKGTASNNPKTVLNNTATSSPNAPFSIKFSDLRGKEYLVHPGQSVSIIGVSSGLLALSTPVAHVIIT